MASTVRGRSWSRAPSRSYHIPPPPSSYDSNAQNPTPRENGYYGNHVYGEDWRSGSGRDKSRSRRGSRHISRSRSRRRSHSSHGRGDRRHHHWHHRYESHKEGEDVALKVAGLWGFVGLVVSGLIGHKRGTDPIASAAKGFAAGATAGGIWGRWKDHQNRLKQEKKRTTEAEKRRRRRRHRSDNDSN